MARFDAQAFMRAHFQPRTAELRLESLREFFGDAEPVWTVRGLTASEMARSMEAADTKNKSIDAVLQALTSSKAKVDELRAALGMSGDVPGEIIKRLEQLTICSVDPVIDLPIAVKLGETYPIEFYMLTNKIVHLTGLGMDLKKPLASGQTTPSET